MRERELEIVLEVRGLSKRFGGVHAVEGVDLGVPARQVFGLIGPNGAGKTTLINLVSGHLRPDLGTVRLGGVDVTGMAPHELARRGVARTFQGVRLFKGLSVIDNVLIGMHTRLRADVLQRLVPFAPADRAARDRAMALLGRVGLAKRAADLAGELAYGDQRRCEIARALASAPTLLILDEPAAGMNPTESARLRELLAALAAEGLTIVLIEHDVRLVMDACARVAVLNFGRKIAEGVPADVQRDRAVREAYLGADESAS